LVTDDHFLDAVAGTPAEGGNIGTNMIDLSHAGLENLSSTFLIASSEADVEHRRRSLDVATPGHDVLTGAVEPLISGKTLRKSKKQKLLEKVRQGDPFCKCNKLHFQLAIAALGNSLSPTALVIE
jgi:hypothetical protein